MAHFSALRAAFGFIAAAPILILSLAATDAAAYSGNPSAIYGRTNKTGGSGCAGCHSSGSTTAAISGAALLNKGQASTYTVTVNQAAPNGTRVGVTIAASDANQLSLVGGMPTVLQSGGSGNEVIHSTSAGTLRTISSNSATYTFTFTMPSGATSGATYTLYAVGAVGFYGSGHATNFTVKARPSAPTTVSASSITASSVMLTWTGTGPEYRIVYKTGASAPTSETDGTTLDVGTVTSTTVTGLTASTQYSFAVYAKLAGESVFSSSAATTSATTSASIVAPRYVNAGTGSDTGACASSSSPCKTITYAMGQATTGSPGDSVNVAPGTYNMALGETFPITMKSGVQLQSTGTAATTIVDATGANARVFNASGGNASTVIQGFTITGGLHLPATNSNAQGGAMLIDNLAQIKVRRNIFVDNEARGYAGVAPSSPSGGVAYGGAIVSSNASPTIENNVFTSNTVRGGNGVSKFDGSAGGGGGHGHGGAVFAGGGAAVIVNNTFYANEAIGGSGGSSTSSGGSGGLAFNGAVESNNASVVNNIFVNNSSAGGLGGSGAPAGNSFNGALNDNGGPSTTNNLFFGNTAGSNGDTQGTNPVLLDPQFQAAPTNLRILTTSPAKGAGTATGAPATDLEGTARPNPPSIGAYEASDPTVTYNLVAEGWQQVAPYVATPASGTGTATYNSATRALTLNLSYSGLSSSEIAAHIHGPAARGANASVYFSLAAGSPKTDTVTLTTQQATELNAGQLYVNIHTTTYGAGELRAQIDNAGATTTRVLTVTKAGSGTGTVTGTAEPGTVINCGGDCTETAPNGKVVTLTAAGSGGSTFRGWSGGVCSGTAACPVTMDAAKSVTATFDPPSTGASADLSVTASISPNPASAAKDVMLTLTVTNNGPATATGITFFNPIPSGSTYIWKTLSCGLNGITVTCNPSSLAPNASVVFKVVVRPNAAGSITNEATVAANESDPNTTNNTATTLVTVNTNPIAQQVLRYRLYSDVTKEHHFTTDLNEYTVLGGNGNWVQEGTVGKVLNNPGSFNGVAAAPYYRLYDTGTRWHHWTTDANEYYTLIEFPNWNAEGVDGYILPTQATGSIPLYRLLYPFIPGLHHWTVDQNEYNTLITPSYGWIGEGGSGFVIP